MILILSDDSDQSTSSVIDWLTHYEAPFIRINETTELHLDHFRMEGLSTNVLLTLTYPAKLNLPKLQINLNDVTSFWYRRGYLNIPHPVTIDIESLSKEELQIYNIYLKDEIVDLGYFIHFLLLNKKSLGSIHDNSINKLIVMKEAQAVGLTIPSTEIISQKKQFKKSNTVIAKAIRNNAFRLSANRSIGGYASLFSMSDMPEHFFYSLLQQFINKEYDLRSFYLDGRFYTAAILSAKHPTARIDFRNRDIESRKDSLRILPYALPKEIEAKLHQLMKRLNLKTGSIDLALSFDEQYFFLEINPIGQYDFISKRCNFQLDREIAKFLIR